jgi:hypothetical protein
MTKLTNQRRPKRETQATDRCRPICIELFPFYLGIRVKGQREFYAVPWEAVLDLGRKIDAREKLAARKGAA